VAAGRTVVLVPVTAPTAWSTESEVAPVTLHARTALPPGATEEGEAVKEAITGGDDPPPPPPPPEPASPDELPHPANNAARSMAQLLIRECLTMSRGSIALWQADLPS
jgi:hypothetical protein